MPFPDVINNSVSTSLNSTLKQNPNYSKYHPIHSCSSLFCLCLSYCFSLFTRHTPSRKWDRFNRVLCTERKFQTSEHWCFLQGKGLGCLLQHPRGAAQRNANYRADNGKRWKLKKPQMSQLTKFNKNSAKKRCDVLRGQLMPPDNTQRG